MRTIGRWVEARLGIGMMLNWFITRPIAFSLPGISRAEKTTTSSASSFTCR